MPARVHQKYAQFRDPANPGPTPMDMAQGEFMASAGSAELDHIGAILVRELLGLDFDTGAHIKVEMRMAK